MDTYDKLYQEAEQIQGYLEELIEDDAHEAAKRAGIIFAYMARTAKMLADAKMILTRKRNEVLEQVLVLLSDQKLSAKLQNSYIDSLCYKEQYLVDWLERLNAACSHGMDLCRSVIGLNRSEMELTKNMGREIL